MTDPTNPWLTPEPASASPAPATAAVQVATTGPLRPQAGVPAPDLVDQLPTRRVERTAALWVVGAHGGAGESTLADLDDSWTATAHAWPSAGPGDPARVLVVARTSARGLLAAKAAAKQWAAGLVPDVDLLGLVLVADAPGRLPKPLRDLAKVVSGGYPRTWRIGWVEAWRLGEPPSAALPRETMQLVDDLRTILSTTTTGVSGATSRKDFPDGPA